LVDPPAINATSSFGNASCGLANGVINVSVSGGNAPYNYSWNTNDTLPNLSNLNAGTYSLHISDTYNCGQDITVTVNNIPIIAASVTASATTICEGDSVYLSFTDPGIISYSWNTGETTTTINVIPSSTSIYYLRTTDTLGCVTTDSVDIVVTPMPAASISYAGTPFCSNISSLQPVTLTGTSGGMFSSGPLLNYNASTGDIDPSSSTPGTYLVTYTIAASGGCQEVIDSTIVIVTSLPYASISYVGTPFCINNALPQAVTITGTTGGIYTTTPLGLTINSSTGVITPATSLISVYNVTYSVAAANGCPDFDTSTTIEIRDLASLTGTINISGQPINKGRVGLYTLDSTHIPKATAIALIDVNGIYSFTNVPSGNYLVRAIADSNNYPNAIPTYSGDEFRWDSSIVWSAVCGNSDTVNINVINIAPPTQAGAIISGFIWDDSDTLNQRRGIRKPGEPIKGVGVIIQRRPGGSASMRTTSDTITGQYVFANVDTGNYDIYVEMPSGTMVHTYDVSVDAATDVFENLDFFVDSTSGKIDTANVNNADSVFATRVITTVAPTGMSVKLFPVPVKELSRLIITTDKSTEIKLFIEDITGRSIVSSRNLDLEKGENSIALEELYSAPAGIYLIKVEGAEINVVMKVSKN
jgi:hypothetical protein